MENDPYLDEYEELDKIGEVLNLISFEIQGNLILAFLFPGQPCLRQKGSPQGDSDYLRSENLHEIGGRKHNDGFFIDFLKLKLNNI